VVLARSLCSRQIGLIGGLPDKGKGLISADIIARCTTGADWPCNEGRAAQGDVVWFTAEDNIEDTVVPRLAAAGAERSRVHIVGMARNRDGSPRMFNLATDPLQGAKKELGVVSKKGTGEISTVGLRTRLRLPAPSICSWLTATICADSHSVIASRLSLDF
jgi:hypothetical protein